MTRPEAAEMMRRAASRIHRLAGADGAPADDYALVLELDAAARALAGVGADGEATVLEEAERLVLEAQAQREVAAFSKQVFACLTRRLFDAGFAEWASDSPHAPFLHRMLRASITQVLMTPDTE